MHHHNHQDQQQQPSMAQNFNMVIAIAQYISMISEVFTRLPGTWGKRHAGLHMGVSWVILFCFGGFFFRHDDPMPMFYLWVAATSLLLLHRIVGAVWPPRVHSLYTGTSIFSIFTSNESLAKGTLEPMAFVLAGALVGKHSPPMGVYFFVVAVCGFIANAWMVHVEQARMQAAEDAFYDAQIMQREMQKRMGE
jgi:hypothetical protein